MSAYTCTYCLFSTDKKYNYTRHCNSPKHLKAVTMFTQKKNNIDKLVLTKKTGVKKTNEHTCSLCKATFAHKTSLYRHKRTWCKNNPKILTSKCNKKDDKIKDLEANIVELNNECEKKTSENKKLLKEVKSIKLMLKEFIKEQKKCNEEIDDKIDKIDTLYEMCKLLFKHKNLSL